DVDWFRFTAKKGQAIEVNVYARRLRSPVDSTIEVTDAKGAGLGSNDDGPGAGADSVVKFTAAADGEYFVKVRDQFENAGPDFAYRVEVTPQQPSVTMSIPQVARNDSQSRQFITVPRGNRFATMISAKRANFAGDLAFDIANLPGGVKMHSETLSTKLEQQPLVFEAAADAPIGGKFVDLVAKPTDTSKSAESIYRHDIEFVAGPNNTYYYGTHELQLYVAVCEEAPFTLHIEEPKAPLVQYGALDLNVVVKRRAGFVDPIQVKMMWNPPGVSSLPDITIPKGSNSAIYTLNAKPDAQPNKWKIAVLGSIGTENRADRGGTTFVSSSLTPLEVGEPFVVGTISPVMVSPGQETKLICKLDQKKPFEGKARVRVLGLPEGVIASDAEITSADKEVIIKLKIGEKVPHASYRNFLCAADVIHNGQTIPHNLASGAVIRVVPPKSGATKQVAAK
ncbi:MAG TPA: PPC domain-containing protein, partial [Candidatus Acidoferrum sp.]|nr:PPC domain-containing protein [Candidatus Acidoferrum sp.]